MCFRCLIIIVCQDLVIFALFYCLLNLRSGECDVVFLYVSGCSVNESVCFVCCVFVNCLVKQFTIYLGVLFCCLM